MILRALELGVTWLDTASNGRTFARERLIGAPCPPRSCCSKQTLDVSVMTMTTCGVLCDASMLQLRKVEGKQNACPSPILCKLP